VPVRYRLLRKLAIQRVQEGRTFDDVLHLRPWEKLMPHPWQPWHREWGTIKVAQMQFSNFAGAGYKFARNRSGRFKRFLTRKGAQEYADYLNAQQDKEN